MTAGVGLGHGRASSTSAGLVSARALPGRSSSPTPASSVALEVLRHHRLLELYLAEALGVPWDRVHDEAEVLEHVLSEELEELIAAKLGHPTIDPHGDPIPTARRARSTEPDHAVARRARCRDARRVRARLRRRLRRCCATSPSAASPRATASRSSSASRSTDRCSRDSATTSTCSAARWPRRCAWRCERVNPPPPGTAEVDAGAAAAAIPQTLPVPDLSPLERLRSRGRAARGRRAARPGLRRRDRLRGPGQLRHEHRRAARSTATCCCG